MFKWKGFVIIKTKLHIGLCGPIKIRELSGWVSRNFQEKYSDIGVGGPSVNLLANELLNRGHKLSLFSLDPKLEKPLRYKSYSLNINVLPMRGRMRALDFFRTEKRRLREEMEGSNIDILHGHWTYEYAQAVLRVKVPYVISVRDWAPEILRQLDDKGYRFLRLLMNHYTLKKAENLICNSEYLREKVERGYRKRAVVIPNGMPINVFRSRSISDKGETPIIVAVNNGFNALKNTKTTLKAFRILKKILPNATLQMFGMQYERGGIAHRWAVFHKLHYGVEFAGEKPKEELLYYVRKADMLVHASLEESFGNVLIEAMAVGTPCIGGVGSGAVPSVLNNGEAGVLTDVTSPEMLADQMVKVLVDLELWYKYSKNGYTYALQNFSMPSVAEKTEQEYQRILRT